MSALQAFLFVGGVVLAGVLTRVGWDICGHQRRLGRMKREAEAAGPRQFLGVEMTPPFSASAGTEKERIAVRVPHTQVEPCGASTDKRTGAGVSDGDHASGSGVTAGFTTKGTEGTKGGNFLAGMSTGAGADDSTTAGSRVTANYCARCRHIHFLRDSLLCDGCREVLQANADRGMRNAERGGA